MPLRRVLFEQTGGIYPERILPGATVQIEAKKAAGDVAPSPLTEEELRLPLAAHRNGSERRTVQRRLCLRTPEATLALARADRAFDWGWKRASLRRGGARRGGDARHLPQSCRA